MPQPVATKVELIREWEAIKPPGAATPGTLRGLRNVIRYRRKRLQIIDKIIEQEAHRVSPPPAVELRKIYGVVDITNKHLYISINRLYMNLKIKPHEYNLLRHAIKSKIAQGDYSPVECGGKLYQTLTGYLHDHGYGDLIIMP
jgi:hypothetical protein